MFPRYGISNDEASVLKLRWVCNALLLPVLSAKLLPRVVVHIRVLSMGQIDTFENDANTWNCITV